MRLVLIDAANCLYRAFFAIPPLRAADGFPTNALHGFANMLGKVMREEQPTAVAIAFDPPGPSFRKEVFPAYKAKRDAQPEDLSAQFPVARELATAAGFAIVEVPGFEADDVIATLVRRAPQDAEVVIISSDKDLMQLVTDRVVLLDGMKDKRIGPAEVEARFGVPPEQLLDVRALVGDPSDNIPGVKGIGEKGAAKLIAEWGDLENLLAHAEEVKAKKAREALVEQADEARLSKQLATLQSDVSDCPDPASLEIGAGDPAALRALYERLELKRLLDALDAGGGAGAPAAEVDPVEIERVETPEALAALVSRLAEQELLWLSPVGMEGPGGLPPDPVGFGFALSEERAAYVVLGDAIAPAALASALAPLLEGGAARPWAGRDTKRMQTWLAEQGVSAVPPSFDIELAAFLLDPAAQRTNVALASALLGRRIQSLEDLAGRGAKAVPAAELATDDLAHFGAEEVCALRRLGPELEQRLEKDGLLPLLRDVELPLTRVLSGMEREGVRIDEERLKALSVEWSAELERVEKHIHELAGEEFAVASPKQLQHILFEKLGLKPLKKTKTGFSTDESVLEQLSADHELPAQVLAYRQLAKLRSTYVDALPPLVNPATGRVHPTFNQTGAATGRLSSTHPNVQNIPIRTQNGVRIREAFIPAEGATLVSADYSQVELRILAHFSGDQSLIEAFRAGEDIHRRTAAEVAGILPEEVDDDQRARAKAVNFGIIYGLSAFGLANQLRIPAGEAQQTIDAYFERYRGVRRFLDETIEAARADGCVRTLLGRRRFLPEIDSRNRARRQAAERVAVNTVIQGTAADLMKRAMVDVQQALEDAALRSRIILQVHDELVFDAPTGETEALEDLARTHMEGVYALEVPLVVDVGAGASWREAH